MNSGQHSKIENANQVETTSRLKSLLKLVQTKLGSVENFLEKDFQKIQQNSQQKTLPLILNCIKKVRVSSQMFVNYCLLSRNRNKEIHSQIMSSTEQECTEFLKNSNHTMFNLSTFKDDLDYNRVVLFPYGGGKSNRKSDQHKIVSNILRNNPSIDTYYEPFLGGFGSVYNSLPLLIKHGIKNIHLSDINPSLINVFRQVQKKHKQVQKHLSNISLNYYREYGKLYPENREESKELFTKLHDEFTNLEKQKKMNPRRSALFLYLIHNCQGGMLSFDMKTKTTKFSFSFDRNKRQKISLLINKVEIFHHILNSTNITFRVRKYETVIQKMKNEKNSLILFDSPYIEYSEEEKTTIKDCSYNYGLGSFNHKQLLNKIKNSDFHFVYYNNHHPLIENFSKKYTFEYMRKDVTYQNGSSPSKSVEIIMYSTIKESSYQPINNTNFFSFKIS